MALASSSRNPLTEPSTLPVLLSPKPTKTESPNIAQVGKNDLIHPSFLPPCEHGRDDGDMHAHAFDLLSLSGGTPAGTRPPLPATKSTNTTHAVPSSVPANSSSFLSSSRPPTVPATIVEKKENGAVPPKARRMSSSTTGVLGRGKLGLTGTADNGLGLGGVAKDIRAPAYSGSTPIPNRRPTISGSPVPQLFDFARTDRRPSQPYSRSTTAIPASLPARNGLHLRQAPPTPADDDDIELDMEFDGDDDDEGEGSGRSVSADIDMDMDDEDGEVKKEWEKLALGTGSGGVKGRRKGMVFKCENCGKEYRHPSCLIKHRWEHSPHWKEPTALSMSKHQQVQMLEAAAILAHLDPTANPGRSLPNDKSLWPAVLSPHLAGENAKVKPARSNRDPSLLRSPPSSVIQPLTPSSLREPLSLGTLAERNMKERKSSPGSDSTTSSMGAGEPYIPQTTGLGIKNGASSPYSRPTRPVGIQVTRPRGNSSSLSSSIPGPATPQSVGSLPDMAGLNFRSGSIGNGSIPNNGMSPIPNRTMPLYLKAGMVGGGMFGAINTAVPSSSVRSGAADLPEDDEEGEEDDGWGRGKKGSSEEAEERRKNEGEEWAGMAMEMEL